ncbi:MAG: hypothetical protein ACYDEN_08410 [Acidimicrobiales bacterium]
MNLLRVEAHEVADLGVGDAPFVDEAAEMADAVVSQMLSSW